MLAAGYYRPTSTKIYNHPEAVRHQYQVVQAVETDSRAEGRGELSDMERSRDRRSTWLLSLGRSWVIVLPFFVASVTYFMIVLSVNRMVVVAADHSTYFCTAGSPPTERSAGQKEPQESRDIYGAFY